MQQHFDIELIDALKKEALKSNVSLKHSAAFIKKKGKQIIQIGYNQFNFYNYKKQIQDSKKVTPFSHLRYTKHAEQHASLKMINTKSFNDNSTFDIIIIRINKNNKLRYSRPCNNCIEYLRNLDYPIKNVYYSTNDEIIVMERLIDMEKLHKSKAYSQCE